MAGNWKSLNIFFRTLKYQADFEFLETPRYLIVGGGGRRHKTLTLAHLHAHKCIQSKECERELFHILYGK